jgi:hypothetical protein
MRPQGVTSYGSSAAAFELTALTLVWLVHRCDQSVCLSAIGVHGAEAPPTAA